MTEPSGLTTRQRQVAALVADGLTPKRIGARLGIGERRVRKLVASISRRIHADPERDEYIQVAVWWSSQQAA